jgi:hypothetical protein
MKKLVTSVFLSMCFLLAFAQNSKAANYYYVSSNQKFVLKPVVGTLVKFLWTIDGVSKEVLAADAGILEHTFNSATTSIVEHKVSLQVLSALDGCLSNLVEYTIVELPALVVNVTDPAKKAFCEGTLPDLELTASITLPTNLAAFDVKVSPFKWSRKDGVPLATANITGANNSKLQVVAAGEYICSIAYELPTDGIFKPLASKLAEVVGVTRKITADVALPTLPVISLE